MFEWFASPLRLAYRDIGGSDPERMAAPRVAEYVQELFNNSPVKVEWTRCLMSANKNILVGCEASIDRQAAIMVVLLGGNQSQRNDLTLWKEKCTREILFFFSSFRPFMF